MPRSGAASPRIPRDRPPSARALVASLAEGPAPRLRGTARRLARPLAVAAAVLAAATGATAGLLATTGGDEDAPPPAPLARVVTEPPLTVPAPGGAEVPARPARQDDLPGLEGARGAAAADVGDVRVVSVPGARGSSRPPRRRSRGP